ncbi:MAG: purine-nucleoside phosphorylase [Polyangiaceae bacterium]
MSISISALVDDTAQAIQKKISVSPRIGVVLGSGLGAFGDSIEDLQKVPYAELPHLPASKVAGHAGNFCFGNVSGVPVACMQGRVHLYEGHSVASVVHGVRTMARLGAKAVLITNAAGCLEVNWNAGDLMLITDHLNLTHTSPLIGPNEDALGPRFPDMTHAYDLGLQQALLDVAEQVKIELREGIYAALLGPTYETPAEVRMLRGLGAHAVGMSTVVETIALRHMGVKVGALSCLTNMAAGLAGEKLDHAEVEATAKRKREDLLKLLRGWIVAAGKLS